MKNHPLNCRPHKSRMSKCWAHHPELYLISAKSAKLLLKVAPRKQPNLEYQYTLVLLGIRDVSCHTIPPRLQDTLAAVLVPTWQPHRRIEPVLSLCHIVQRSGDDCLKSSRSRGVCVALSTEQQLETLRRESYPLSVGCFNVEHVH